MVYFDLLDIKVGGQLLSFMSFEVMTISLLCSCFLGLKITRKINACDVCKKKSMQWPPFFGSNNISFSIHGLWPKDSLQLQRPELCTQEAFNPKVASQVPNLAKIWPSYGPKQNMDFWKHEWNRHGTCSGLSQEYSNGWTLSFLTSESHKSFGGYTTDDFSVFDYVGFKDECKRSEWIEGLNRSIDAQYKHLFSELSRKSEEDLENVKRKW